MTPIEQTLYTVLSTNVAVAALVSTRIYPLLMPQNTAMPCVVYQRISSVPVTSINGDSGLDSVRIQVSCWAGTFAGAKGLASAVRSAVDGSSLLKSVTLMEMDDIDNETRNFRSMIDFSIWQK